MFSLNRRKLCIIPVLLYWPVLALLTSIPIPQLVRRAGVSDKVLHFLAFLILFFLLWFAVSPAKKAKWGKPAVWWVFFIVVIYGAVNERLQLYVGRSADVRDFAANFLGAAGGLIFVTFISSWSAWLMLTGISIFLLKNITRVKLYDLIPQTDALFHLLAYAVFTLFWLCNLYHLWRLRAPSLKWLISAMVLPCSFLFAVEFYSVISGKGVVLRDIILSSAAIAVVVGATFLSGLIRQNVYQKASKNLN